MTATKSNTTSTAAKNHLLIANGQGFWGDSILGPVRLVQEGPLHYLTLDYLAEVTMSIMQKQKSRNPEAGYATDFVQMLERVLPACKDKGIKVIANAGGVNPRACLRAVVKVVKKLGLTRVRIGIVEGDDITAELSHLIDQGHPFLSMDSKQPLRPHLLRVLSANVYLGAAPVVEALRQGADVVITGRVTDPSLVVAPMVHEFGWSMQDFDQLAAATIAGHIVECGAQCTGGNYTHWRKVPNLARIGYPIVEAEKDGSFVITKHEGTGGLVDLQTVTSQLVYEMGDPRSYYTPDCIADFTSIELREDGRDRVRLCGIRGRPPTDTYKVSISYHKGYKAASQLTIAGPDAVEKAKLCADIVWQRLKLDGLEFSPEERCVEILGTNVCHAGIAAPPQEPAEVVLRIGVKCDDEDKCDRFGMEIVPLVTSGPPGVTGFAGARAKASDVVGYWPALLDKKVVTTSVTVEEV